MRVKIYAAFSLVELLVVLTLLALASSAALVMVRYPLAQTRRETLMVQLEQLDGLARDLARKGKTCSLEINADSGGIVLLQSEPDRSIGKIDGQNAKLAISDFCIPSEPRSQSQASIEFLSPGVSPSYAVAFGNRGDADMYWVVFSGLSGECMRYTGSENEVRAILTPAPGL